MIRSRIRFASLADPDDLIAEDASGSVRVGQRPFFNDLIRAVVSQAADVTAVGLDDVIEQRELGIAAVHHVQPIGLDRPFQYRAFVMFAAAVRGDVDPRRHVTIDFEMRVQPPLHQAAARLSSATKLP